MPPQIAAILRPTHSQVNAQGSSCGASNWPLCFLVGHAPTTAATMIAGRAPANNPQVEVAPCTARGKPKGSAVKALCRILNPSEEPRPRSLISQKYGWQVRIVDGIILPMPLLESAA